MSVQYAAMASQKFTWPCFTAVVPASTVAVSVTRLPAFTEVTTTPFEVTASEVVVVVRANAEELIAAVHTISATFSNSNGRRAAVLTDANWSSENMLFDSHNCATCSRTRSVEETRRKRGSGPDCRFGKEVCAIELKEPKFLTISRTSRIVLLFHQLVTCAKTCSSTGLQFRRCEETISHNASRQAVRAADELPSTRRTYSVFCRRSSTFIGAPTGFAVKRLRDAVYEKTTKGRDRFPD